MFISRDELDLAIGNRPGEFERDVILPPNKPTPQFWSSVVRGYDIVHMSLIFELILQVPSSNFSHYSEYQTFLSDTIIELRRKDMSYNEVSDWLNDNGFKTPRGKRFRGTHVFSIEKKKRIRDERMTKGVKSSLQNFDLQFFTNDETLH